MAKEARQQQQRLALAKEKKATRKNKAGVTTNQTERIP